MGTARDRYLQLVEQGRPVAFESATVGGHFNPNVMTRERVDYDSKLRAYKELADQEAAMEPLSNIMSGFNSSSSGSGGTGGYSSGSVNPYEARLNALLDDPSSISQTGAYKFQEAEGRKALERSAAAKGMLGSGNTLAALLSRGQQQAQSAYGTEADRLSGLVGQRYGYDTEMADAAAKRYAADIDAKTEMAKTMYEIASKRTPISRTSSNQAWI